jgi:hypothetical protein
MVGKMARMEERGFRIYLLWGQRCPHAPEPRNTNYLNELRVCRELSERDAHQSLVIAFYMNWLGIALVDLSGNQSLPKYEYFRSSD